MIDSAVFALFREGLGYDLQPGDPVTSRLPFVSSPAPLMCAIAAYLIAVGMGVAKLKAAEKAGRKMVRPNALIMLMVLMHNAFLVVLSLYMCVGVIVAAVRSGYRFTGNSYDPKDSAMVQVVYVFYMSKLYEFLDTIIMIVKGNLRQVSFLHVYHHVSISFIWWSICYNAPGGEAYLSIAMNSWVHVCMYLYYFLTAIIKGEESRKKYLWWGRYLTQMQMLQFMTNLVHGGLCIVLSPYPKFFSISIVVYMLTLLVLFGQFYVAKYGGKKKTKKSE